jgi:hypothetical protein
VILIQLCSWRTRSCTVRYDAYDGRVEKLNQLSVLGTTGACMLPVAANDAMFGTTHHGSQLVTLYTTPAITSLLNTACQGSDRALPARWRCSDIAVCSPYRFPASVTKGCVHISLMAAGCWLILGWAHNLRPHVNLQHW